MNTEAGIVIGDTRATRFSADLDTTAHASHAVKLLVGLDADVCVREETGRVVKARALVIPSNLPSSAVSPGPVITLMLDPEHHREANGRARAIGHSIALEPAVTRRLRDAAWSMRHHLHDAKRLVELGDELEALAFPRTLQRISFDRRIERSLEHFRAYDPDEGEPLTKLVWRTGITAQHFRALFLRDIGLSPRAWMVWNRLVRGLRVALSGDPVLTMAAIRAGFSDHAHFSRTCRRLLGYTPSDIVLPRVRPHDLRFVQDVRMPAI